MTASIDKFLTRTSVIPVLTVARTEQAVPLAHALAAGGLNVIEVTLRTDVALAAIERIAREVPETVVGAGTVLSADDMKRAEGAGARFAVSPGAPRELLQGAAEAGIPLLPGIVTATEVMRVRASGFTHAKFFPAEPAGGVAALRALGGPFPDMRFCPTGGIGPANFQSYLSLPNVTCVGGTWVAPADAVQSCDWQRITTLAREAASAEPTPGSSAGPAGLR